MNMMTIGSDSAILSASIVSIILSLTLFKIDKI